MKLPHQCHNSDGFDLPHAPFRASDRRTRLAATLGGLCGVPDSWNVELIGHKAFRSGRWRQMFKATNRISGRQIVIKTSSSKRKNRQEYAAIQSLRNQTEDCVTPLYLAADASFFVIDWIDAPLLADELNGAERPAALVKAGQWLSRLHRSTLGRAPKGRALHGIRLPFRPGDGPAGTATQVLRERARHLSIRRAPHSMLHGDIHAGNFFDPGDRLLAIDREREVSGPCFFDVAKFLIDIGYRRAEAAQSDQPWDGSNDDDRRSFFDGYGPIHRDHLALFDLIEDKVLFKKWRLRQRRPSNLLDGEMRRRGLIDPISADERPGRLVEDGRGAAHWTIEPATLPGRRKFAFL